MKKLFIFTLCFITLIFSGCATSKKDQNTPTPPKSTDTAHLTAEENGVIISVSRELRDMSQLIPTDKKGYEVRSVLVKIENNAKANLIVSPDFVTLKTSDGLEYKYAPSLTNDRPLGKSAFEKRSIPPDYQGGGLLLFEIKTGAKAESLTYKDDSGHSFTLKFQTNTQTNI